MNTSPAVARIVSVPFCMKFEYLAGSMCFAPAETKNASIASRTVTRNICRVLVCFTLTMFSAVKARQHATAIAF